LYVDSLVVDIYTPTGDTAANRPVILLSHAGSFLPNSFTGLPFGTKSDSCLIEMCTRFAKMGYVAASFDYRLGWNPLGADQETRAKTIILAVYKAMQDAKTLIRYFRANASTYKVAQDKFVVGGSNSGAYVALAAGNLNQGSELSQAKFVDSTGNPFIDTTLWGNFDGFGGQLNNENHAGEASDFQLVLSLGGDVGDLSWINAGEPPVVAFHGVADPGSPYETAVVIVAATGQPVIEVSGPGHYIPYGDNLGNQDALKGGDFCAAPASTDGNVYEGNYPFYGVGFEPWGWYSAATPVNPNASKGRALAYIDTIIAYFAPRAYKVLIDDTYTDPCVGINETKVNDVDVELFPNPSSTEISIRVNDASQAIRSIQVFDIAGKLARSEDVKNLTRYTLGRKGLENGVYFVNIQFTSGGQTYRRVMFE
ncbi:MAG TPA: T9SS type A sorting domain-containing protein, partial [Chitinophagales bacterium]|nr:T9SS type A sorting domain-containing protein [Chitinophagales bacterium]